MPPLPLNPDGTINTDRYAYEQVRDSTSSKKSNMSNNDDDTSGLSAKDRVALDQYNKQIELYKDAMKEASGFKRRELEVKVQEAEKDRDEHLQAAQISADASRYGSDQSLAGTKYSSDAGERNSTRSLQGTIYGADSSAASSRYGTDADLYKFNAEQPLKRGEQALSFLTQYENLASHPASFLQASNYARLGHQVEGMPGMMADLLGNVNPNGQPVGNVAFRTGSGPMPQNAAVATFGENPLNLGIRAPAPAMPTWYGPQGQGGGMMSTAFAPVGGYAPSYGAGDHRGELVPSTYGAQGGLLPTYAAGPTRAVASEAGTDGQYQNTYASSPYALQGLTQGQQPMVMNDGRLVADVDPSEDAFKYGARMLMARGAQTWGNQALERMTPNERDMLASAISDAGGSPSDYFEGYERSRPGNSGTGRAL